MLSRCRRQDLNLYWDLPQPGPQPGASANSATPACFFLLYLTGPPPDNQVLPATFPPPNQGAGSSLPALGCPPSSAIGPLGSGCLISPRCRCATGSFRSSPPGSSP